MNHVNKNKGFTLIELMLAMAFIALLLLAIAMTIIQIANIYNRGLILKEQDQVSRSISDDLDQAMRSSTTFSIVPAAKRYVSTTWGGRMCLGQYSYIWNYVKATGSNLNTYTDGTPLKFVKAPDAGATYCTANAQTGEYPAIDLTGAVELLQTGDHNLGLHAFAVTTSPTASDSLSGQSLYVVSFTIGTSDLNAMVADQSACKDPNVAGADPVYCAVQQFTIVVRVVDGVN